MSKKMLAFRLRSPSTWFASPLIFFSPPIFSSARRKKSHLIRSIHNRHANTKETSRASNPMHPPEKENNTSTIIFQSGGSPPFPPGSNCLFSSLVDSLSLGKTVMSSSSREKMFPLKFELTPTSKQSSTVVRPISQFGRHCYPGVSKPVTVDSD